MILTRLQGPNVSLAPRDSIEDIMIDLTLNNTSNIQKSVPKLIPEVMAALENVLEVSDSQILKTYERATEGIRMRFR
jgi:hypothetical protein